jgi:transcriptional regulator with XRE-family HTH domain
MGSGKTFGELLAELLRVRGMTQREFAAKCRLSDGFPGLLVKDKRTPPPESIERMIQALGLSSEDADDFRQAAAMAHLPELFRHEVGRLRRLNSFLLKRLHPALPSDPVTRGLEKFPDEDGARLAFIERTLQLLAEEKAHIKGKPRPKLTGY